VALGNPEGLAILGDPEAQQGQGFLGAQASLGDLPVRAIPADQEGLVNQVIPVGQEDLAAPQHQGCPEDPADLEAPDRPGALVDRESLAAQAILADQAESCRCQRCQAGQ